MFTLDYADVDSRRYVPSRRTLAAALGCSVRTVADMLLEPENPGKTENGSYPLESWKRYFAERKKAREEEDAPVDDAPDAAETASLPRQMKRAMLRERLAKAELAELNAAARRRELVELSEVKNAAYQFSARLKTVHARAATVDAVNALAVLLELDSAKTARLLEFMEKFHDEFCAKISAATENLEGSS